MIRPGRRLPITHGSITHGAIRRSAVVVGFGIALLGALALGGDPASAAPRKAVARPPVGRIDLAWGTPGTVRAVGWMVDPDTSAPLQLWMSIDSRLVIGTADRPRGNLPRSLKRFGTRHGYDISVNGVAAGVHQVCVAAVNKGAGPPLQLVGCANVDVPPALPLGTIDSVTPTPGEQIRIRGWALDVGNVFPVEVRLTVDDREVSRRRAVSSLPGLAWFFPAHGPNHAFDVTTAAGPGRHRVCLSSENFDDGPASVSLGCREVDIADQSPIGALDGLAVTSGAGSATIQVTGRAGDPDATSPSTVRTVATSATLGESTSTSTANGGAISTGLGVGPGTWTVCPTVINQGNGRDRQVGCGTVDVSDRRPGGSLTSVAPAGSSGVRVRGTATDPDGSGVVSVRVSVDGVLRNTVPAAPGYDVTVNGLADGGHRVCVVGVDRPGSSVGVTGDRAWPCGSVIVGPTSVGSTGTSGPSTPVGPPPGHPLDTIDRDAGVSVALPDGSTFWVFGDSLARNADGSLRYFVNNTAAWARPGQPSVTRDAVVGDQPVLFAPPTPTDPPCVAPSIHQAFWPLSAVAVPNGGGTTRVVVYLEKICLGDAPLQFSGREIAVVDWIYDPSHPPDGLPVRSTLVSGAVFPRHGFGSAAVVGMDGRIYAYSCDPPAEGCEVARVSPSSVGDPAAYRYYDGSGWQADPAAAAPMELPVGPGSEGANLPVASFGIAHDDAADRYVMAYMPWPGIGDTALVRIAETPEGPWSPAVPVHLNGCDDAAGGSRHFCYAVAPQPQLSTPDHVGIGYYDQLVAVVPDRGSYVVVNVPFVIVEVP